MGCFFCPKTQFSTQKTQFSTTKAQFSTANDNFITETKNAKNRNFYRQISTIIFYHENSTVRNAKTAKFGTILVGRSAIRLDVKTRNWA